MYGPVYQATRDADAQYQASAPLLVHAREILLLCEHDRGRHDFRQQTPSRLENGRDVGETFARRFLDRFGDDRAAHRICGLVPETNTRCAAFAALLQARGEAGAAPVQMTCLRYDDMDGLPQS